MRVPVRASPWKAAPTRAAEWLRTLYGDLHAGTVTVGAVYALVLALALAALTGPERYSDFTVGFITGSDLNKTRDYRFFYLLGLLTAVLVVGGGALLRGLRRRAGSPEAARVFDRLLLATCIPL